MWVFKVSSLNQTWNPSGIGHVLKDNFGPIMKLWQNSQIYYISVRWIFQNRDVDFLLKIKMLYILNSWELSPSFDIRFRKFSGHHAVASLKPPQTSSNQNAFVEKQIHLLGCWRRAPIKFKWIEKANYWRYWGEGKSSNIWLWCGGVQSDHISWEWCKSLNVIFLLFLRVSNAPLIDWLL